MKKLTLWLICLTILSTGLMQAKTLDQYIQEAENYQNSNEFERAIKIMEEAVNEYPDSAEAYAHLGVVIGEKAQRLQDFSELFSATEHAFQMWSTALSLDPNNITARFYRGVWGVVIPKFAGQLETGINDLEYLRAMFEQSTDSEAQSELVHVYQYLAIGYQKKGDLSTAKQFYEKVIAMALDQEAADKAHKSIEKISTYEEWLREYNKTKKPDSPEIRQLKERIADDQNNPMFLVQLGNAYIDNENYDEAEKVLKRAVRLDPSYLNAYKLLAVALQQLAAREYEPRISIDTDYRTNLVFEVMAVLDKIVALAPDDIEMRYHRGIAGIQMPFFVGTIDQGMDDLTLVLESSAPESLKIDALYWLGKAHEKKAMTYWAEIVSRYPDSYAAQYIFDDLNPHVKRIDLTQYKKPVMIIDFVLGFRDELAPQTAVWIEDKNGTFIKTVYVSGFSGYVQDKQVNLPVWSSSSKFVDVDGVTGASIDVGHHIYVWDTKDTYGKKVKSGDYIIKIEVTYWPSMQYQRVEVPITLGKEDERVAVEEGNLIPYVEITYVK
jgi:tetratricopeptide (TPR) repeat protein